MSGALAPRPGDVEARDGAAERDDVDPETRGLPTTRYATLSTEEQGLSSSPALNQLRQRIHILRIVFDLVGWSCAGVCFRVCGRVFVGGLFACVLSVLG